MKIKAERNHLFSLIGGTQNLIEKRNTMPILANILFRADKGVLRVFATNLEVSLTNEIDVEIEEPGSLAINARNIFNIIKELPEGPVEWETQENDWLKISQKKSVFNIMGVNSEEYPVFPTFETKEFISIDISLLSEMIDKTIFSVSNDETRYHLNGIYFERLDSKGIKMVSTDGHRLSLVDRFVDLEGKGLPMEEGIIIPRRGLNEIKRLIELGESSFQIAIEGSQLIVCQGRTTLMVRLIEGQFPNYQQLIPQELTECIVMNKEKLLSSLKRVSLLSNQKTRNVILSFSEGLLEISAKSPDLGDAKEELEIDYQGKKFQISFNVKYIFDILGSIKEEEIDMELKDGATAGVLRPHGDKDHKCIIMPMHI